MNISQNCYLIESTYGMDLKPAWVKSERYDYCENNPLSRFSFLNLFK